MWCDRRSIAIIPGFDQVGANKRIKQSWVRFFFFNHFHDGGQNSPQVTTLTVRRHIVELNTIRTAALSYTGTWYMVPPTTINKKSHNEVSLDDIINSVPWTPNNVEIESTRGPRTSRDSLPIWLLGRKLKLRGGGALGPSLLYTHAMPFTLRVILW